MIWVNPPWRLDIQQAMATAIELAKRAEVDGQRPYGCVILNAQGARVAYSAGSETPLDPTWHSEIVAIRMACQMRGGLLYGHTLVSTHEPCPMCAGAITHAKISRVVFGSYRIDLPELFRPKLTAAGVLLDTSHPPEVIGGVLREECVALFDREVFAARALRSHQGVTN